MIKKRSYFRNKKILITGHTGFKGSWLTYWLTNLGAKVIGISNDFPTKPSIFKILNKNNKKIISYFKNIEDFKQIKKIFLKHKPDMVFHLAAQSLVKVSYTNPKKTFDTNFLGTLNILECLRNINFKCNAVFITSDKSYKNIEINRGYLENDLLGGKDPYSSSKATAEFAIYSYFNSFLKYKKNIRIGIARAGNVIGGGDWSKDRIIPDIVRATVNNQKINIRNPEATRPWQHVFEIISGYLLLMINLSVKKKLTGEAFNFGPRVKKKFTVLKILRLSKRFWPKIKWKIKKDNNFFESKLLSLNSNKANRYLGWRDVMSNEQKVEYTLEWYKKFYTNKKIIMNFSYNQLKKFTKILKSKIKKKYVTNINI